MLRGTRQEQLPWIFVTRTILQRRAHTIRIRQTAAATMVDGVGIRIFLREK